jgi:transcriptional regulator with XRE-family HTH domain
MMTAGEYLEAVARMQGLTFREMAHALKIDPSLLRRWRRGVLIPSWRRVQAMTALWGGDPYILFLGAVLQRYCRQTGLTLEEARRLRAGKRVAIRRRRRPTGAADRAQLSLPIMRAD